MNAVAQAKRKYELQALLDIHRLRLQLRLRSRKALRVLFAQISKAPPTLYNDIATRERVADALIKSSVFDTLEPRVAAWHLEHGEHTEAMKAARMSPPLFLALHYGGPVDFDVELEE